MSRNNDKRRIESASRRAFLAGSAGAAVAGLAGCTGNGGSSGGNGGGGGGGETVSILASAASPAEKEVWNALSEDFEAETGHTVEWEYVGFGEHNSRLSSMIRGGNAPDLTSWNSASGGNAVVEGIAAPVTEVVEYIGREGDSQIPDRFLMTQEDDVWFLPNALYLQNQNIRGDLVSQVGHEFHPQDITFEEHLNWVQDIDAETDTRGWGGSTATNNCGAQTTAAYLYQNGVHIFEGSTDDIEVIIDQGDNKQRTVEVLQHLNAASETGPSGASWSWGDLSGSFVSGTTSSINYPYGRILASSLDRDAPWAPDSVNWTEPPHGGRSEDERNALAALFGWTVVDQGESKDAAKEFLKFYFTSEHYVDFLHTVPLHYSPILDHIWDDPAYRDHDLIQQKSHVLDLQKEAASRARVPALSADGASFNPLATSSFQDGVIGQMLGEVVHDGVDPEQAVTNAAQNMRDLQ
jgi:multiple sugar transport system substrate-binding protein